MLHNNNNNARGYRNCLVSLGESAAMENIAECIGGQLHGHYITCTITI